MSSTLSFVTSSISVEEGASGTRFATFNVRRVGDLSGVASVDWAVQAQEATASDFAGGVLPSGTLTFAAGAATGTISIGIAGDTLLESNEAFTLVLSSPVNANFGTIGGFSSFAPTATGVILADDGAVLSVSPAGGLGYEGTATNGTVEFVVTRGGDTSIAASASWAVSAPFGPMDAATAADFPGGVLPSGTVAFAAGETSRTILVPVQADALIEGNETFTLTLSSPSTGAVIGAGSATGRIINDEGAPFLRISPAGATLIPEGNSGSTQVAFTVTRTGDPTLAVGANWAVLSSSFGNTVSAQDFVGGVLPSGSVSFAPGEITKTITVLLAGDTAIEPQETLTIALSSPTGGASIDPFPGSVDIQNDDGAVFSLVSSGAGVSDFNLTLGRFGEGNSGTSPATFVIFRDGDLSGAVSVDWSVSFPSSFPGFSFFPSASAADFAGGIAPSGTASFAPNERFKVVTLSLQGDTLAEGNETFNVNLTNPSAGATLPSFPSATMGIGDDDPFALIALAPLAAVAEGNTGATTYTLTFQRSGNLAIASTANWALQPSDLNLTGADFVGGALPSGTVSFAVGETSRQVTFSIQGDTTLEGNEAFFIGLTAPSAGTSFAATTLVTSFTSGSGSIVNDDGAILSIGPGPSAPEGNSGSTPFTFTVTRSGDTSIAASANWAVQPPFTSILPQATAADFAGGTLPSGTVSFAAGETSRTITVNVAGETLNESDETFTVTLSLPSSGASIGTATATGTIQNDDAAGAVVQFASGMASFASEGNPGSGGQATFTVVRSGVLTGTSTVNWSVAPTAAPQSASAADFAGGVLPGGVLTFAPGQATQTITVNFAGDSVIEPNEPFSVVLSSPSVGTALGTFTTQGGQISNDDGAILSVLSGASQQEGNAGSTAFTFTVLRAGDVNTAVSASWTAAGGGLTGVSASDFVGGTLPGGTISFASGETSKTITVFIQGDTAVESNEFISINLSDPSAGAAIAGSFASAQVLDDDGALLTIEGTARTIVEGNSGATPVTFTITRGGNTTITAVANWGVSTFAAPGFATTDGADFPGGSSPSGTVTFLPGETSRDVTINIAGDTLVEANERFTFFISSAATGSNIGAQGSVIATIANDDGAVIAFGAPTFSVSEGNGAGTVANITVTRSGDTASPASASWSVSSLTGPGAPASPGDFVGGQLPSGVVSFAAGETSRTISFQLVGDAAQEPDEAFTVNLANPSAGASIGLQTSIAGTILNDDLPIDGTPGPDNLVGDAADELIRGFGGSDTLAGGNGDDTLIGGEGADRLTGGQGADAFVLDVAGLGRSTLGSMDVIVDFTEEEGDEISLGGINGTLTVGGDTRTFFLNYDTGIELTAAPMLGQKLPAQLFTIPTFQAYWLQAIQPFSFLPEPRGWIVVDLDGDELLGANDFIVEVNGTVASAGLTFPEFELLPDVQLSSTLTGQAGTTGNDNITGTGRAENFTGTTGSDVINGGAGGFNNLSYFGFTAPLNVTFATANSGSVVKGNGSLGTDSFFNVNSVSGGSGADRFDTSAVTLGGFFGMRVTPNAGNDTVVGGFAFASPGDSTSAFANVFVAYGGGASAANVNLASNTASDGYGGTDSLINVRRVAFFGAQNDSITGTAFSDQVASAHTGNRFIDLGAGVSDRWIADTNTRLFTYGPATVRVEVELGTGSSGGEWTGVARKFTFSGSSWTLTGTDTLRGVEQVQGTIGNDLLVGSDADNSFTGNEGADTINGGAGLDTITHTGWSGNSSLSGRGVTVDLAAGTARDPWDSVDVLISIENAYGTQVSDFMTGVAVAGVRTLLRGLGGNDTLRALAQDTLITVDYRGDVGGVVVNLGIDSATDGWGDTDRIFNIQSVIGSNFADVLTGGARNDTLEGARGDDTLSGGAGTDVALFTGARADYVITRDPVTGALTVADSVAARDGADFVASDVETLRFADGDVAAAGFTTLPSTFLALSALAADRAEGNGGITGFTFAVTRSGVLTGTTTVGWAVTGGAASVFDFQGSVVASGSVSFAAGETSRTITVPVVADLALEPDEGFTVTLSGPIGAVITTASAAGTIRNDDVPGISGTLGSDTITPGFVSAGVTGGTPGTGNDVIIGLSGDDSLDGGGGNDVLDGGSGFDRLIGGEGDDTLIGGLGDDFFTPGAGNDSMLGGDQGDVIIPFDATGPLVIDIAAGTMAGQGADSFSGIQNAHGANFADSISGSAANQYFFGRGGNDTIRGLGGSDNFIGGSGDDLLDGGEGQDRSSYDAVDFDPAGPATRGVVVNLSAALIVVGAETVLAGTAIDNWGGRDTLISIEDATGGALGDFLVGSDVNNNLLGGGGNDTVRGGGGNDFINGQEGDDSLDGGEGNDFFAASRGNDTIDGGDAANRNTLGYNNSNISGPITVTFTNTVTGTVAKGDAGMDSFVRVGEVFGSGFGDTFFGSATLVGTISTRVRGGAGNDTIDGAGSVNFVVDYSDALKAINVNLALNTASQDGFDGTDTLNNVRFVRTSGGFNDTITGSAANEWFGLQGAGNKLIDGGAGRDMYRWNGTTAVTVTLGDTLVGGAPAGTVTKFSGVDTVIGIEDFAGGGGNDNITGSSADNLLAGEAGADTLNGGAGFDTVDMNQITTSFTRPGRAIVNLSDAAITVDGVTVQAGTALDGYGAGSTDTLVSIEGVVGTNFDDVIHGSAVANRLSGGDGNDLLLGGAGDDTLIGGADADVAVFAGPRARYAITRDTDTGALTVMDTQAGGDGTDLVDASVETLRFGGVDVLASTLTGSTISIAPLSANKAEGNAGSTAFTFTVTRAGDVTGASSASWSVEPGTASVADFAGGALPSGTVAFAAGETSKVITVNVAGDTLNEASETFSVVLSAPTGAVLGTASATGTIQNDDVPPTVLSLAPVPVDQAEGNAGATAFTFTVTRSGDTSGISSANWSVGGAAAPNDFVGGVRPSGTVTFAAGETTRTITVNVAGDNFSEGDESFTVTLASPTGATLGTASATGLIRDDDFSTFSIAPLSASVAEGNAGGTAFTFTVTRTGNTAIGASVNFAVTGSGGAPATAADFVGGVLPSGTVSFGAGETSRTLTILVAGDAVLEPSEGFTVTLSAASPQRLGASFSATGAILNDEPVTLTGTPDPDGLTGGNGPERIEGLASADTLNGGGGDDTLVGGLGDDRLTGGLGLDRFQVDAGTDAITDLGLGGADVVVVSSGATLNATLAAAWTAGAGTSNAGVANILAQGFGVNLAAAGGAPGWAVSNAGSTRAVAFTGSARNDTLIGGDAADTLNGGAFNDSLVGGGGNDSLIGGTGNDVLEGGAGVDRFVVDAGIDTVRDLGLGGFDLLFVSAGAQARATLGGAWLASASAANDGVATIEAAGFAVNLTSAAGSGTWSVTNQTATGAALTGSARGDTLSGGSGNDIITARDGADVLRGNAGDDALLGGGGDDTMTGGLGVDRFFVDAGTDTVTDLGFGFDALIVSAGATALVTMGGNFRGTALTSNAGVADISASGFNVDVTSATGGSGWVISNAGQARGVSLTGSVNGDTLTGGNGADFLRGGGGADVLSGGASNDQIFGGAGNDTLTGGAGADRINVDAGVDVVTDLGAGGADTLIVAAGATVNATLAAGWTATNITSNAGVANIATNGFGVNLGLAKGTQGWNASNAGSGVGVLMTGSAQADTLVGGSGADTLVGGLGLDVLEGDLGADVFRFVSTAAADGDVILDFNAGQGDVIDLSPLDANGALAGNGAFVFLGGAAFSNVAGQLRFAGGQLTGDVNGDGLADFAMTLNGVGALSAADLLL